MKKMRMTQVARVEDLGPHMRRITLQGEDLADFPVGQESAHFKAIFPRPGQSMPKLGMYLGARKWMRSYTVRAFDHLTKALVVDFAVNDHDGLGTNWAKSAKVGDYLGVAGPGDTKYTNYHADWHLLVADLTALPAAAAILAKLPNTAVGTALLQVPCLADKQPIRVPAAMNVHWIINDDVNNNALLQHLEQLQWRTGSPAIFVAAETGQVNSIKKFLKTKPDYKKEQAYISGYWKA